MHKVVLWTAPGVPIVLGLLARHAALSMNLVAGGRIQKAVFTSEKPIVAIWAGGCVTIGWPGRNHMSVCGEADQVFCIYTNGEKTFQNWHFCERCLRNNEVAAVLAGTADDGKFMRKRVARTCLLGHHWVTEHCSASLSHPFLRDLLPRVVPVGMIAVG
jgi:hypothetical protein